MRPRCAHTNGVTEISASATRLASRTMYVADTASCRQPTRSAPHHRRRCIVQTADSLCATSSPTLHHADSRLALRHIIADAASCRQPTRSAPHHLRHGIMQAADSRQRRVTPRNPIRTTRSAEGAWGVGMHHRYALRRCATTPEAE